MPLNKGQGIGVQPKALPSSASAPHGAAMRRELLHSFLKWIWPAIGGALASVGTFALAAAGIWPAAKQWVQDRFVQVWPVLETPWPYLIFLATFAVWLLAFVWSRGEPAARKRDAPARLLAHVEVELPAELRLKAKQRWQLTFINSGLEKVVVKNIKFLIVDYEDRSREVAVNLPQKFRDASDKTMVAHPMNIPLISSRVKSANAECFITQCVADSITLNGSEVERAFELPEDCIAEIILELDFDPQECEESNVLAFGLIVDFLGRDGVLTRRVLPGYSHIQYKWDEETGVREGSGFGPVVVPPLLVLPVPSGEGTCAMTGGADVQKVSRRGAKR